MVSFSQAKDMFRLQREAKRVKKELKAIHVEAEAISRSASPAVVRVVVTAEQEIVSITIDEGVPREEIPGLVIDCLNRALKKAQVVSAEKMQGIMGEMGMPTGK